MFVQHFCVNSNSPLWSWPCSDLACHFSQDYILRLILTTTCNILHVLCFSRKPSTHHLDWWYASIFVFHPQLPSCLFACLALMAFCVTVDRDDPVMLAVSTMSMSLQVKQATSLWREALRAKKNSWEIPASKAPRSGPIQYTCRWGTEKGDVTLFGWSKTNKLQTNIMCM